MNGASFLNLTSGEKKKVVKTAIRGANKDQKELVEKYRKLEKESGHRR